MVVAGCPVFKRGSADFAVSASQRAEFQTDASLTGASGQPCIGLWLQGAYNSLSYQQLSGLFSYVPPCLVHISIWEMFAVVVVCVCALVQCIHGRVLLACTHR